MRTPACFFLRPYRALPILSRPSSYSRFYDAWHYSCQRRNATLANTTGQPNMPNEYQKRMNKLRKKGLGRLYPRVGRDERAQVKSPKDIHKEYSHLGNGEANKNVLITVNGTVRNLYSRGQY